MSIDNPITEFLRARQDTDWTIVDLAEQLLSAIASQPNEAAKKLLIDAEFSTDRQFERVFRPLLACLATMSATESGTSPRLYGGHLSFKRVGPEGPVWILGEFENKPGNVRVVFRRSSSPSGESQPLTTEPPVNTDSNSRIATPTPNDTLDRAG